MYKIYIGEISSKRQKDWFCSDDNPYAVWEGDALLEIVCNICTWITADEIFRDRVDVDWGSIAWKANKAEIIRFFKECRWSSAGLAQFSPKKNYAVVFVESVWGDSA